MLRIGPAAPRGGRLGRPTSPAAACPAAAAASPERCALCSTGNLPVKPNKYVEDWGVRREHIENEFRWVLQLSCVACSASCSGLPSQQKGWVLWACRTCLLLVVLLHT